MKGNTLGGTTIALCYPPGTSCWWTESVPVVTINNLVFEDIDSPTDTNPTANGGGLRIFPERTTPGDTVNRRRIRVKATLSLPVQNVWMHFKSFDVDDPTAYNNKVDRGANYDGGDNRGNTPNGILSAPNSSGSNQSYSIFTDINGVAEVDLLVTQNPGDNFKVAATGSTAIITDVRVDGTDIEDSSNNTLPITGAKVTPLLTVWRKMHIELDNMGQVAGNWVTGTITTATQVGSTTVLDLSSTPQCDDYDGQPRAQIVGLSNYGIVGCDYYNNRITIDKKVSVPGVTGATFYIYDDDDYDELTDDDIVNNGDSLETSIGNLDSLTRMQESDDPVENIFAPAFIRPVFDGGGNASWSDPATFTANVATTDVATPQLFNDWDSNGQGMNDFWIVYLQIGYQPDLELDGDPSLIGWGVPTEHRIGETPAYVSNSINDNCTGMPRGGYFSIIYQETQRDWFWLNWLTNDNSVAPHEIGHAFGLDHIANTHMGEGWDGYNKTAWDPEHLHILRCRVKSPGYN